MDPSAMPRRATAARQMCTNQRCPSDVCAPAAGRRPPCDGAQVYRQVREIGEGPRSQKVVHVRQSRLETARERRIVDGADERVQPDKPMTTSLQSSYLFAQHLWIAAIPSVGDEENH